jgi:hypothetical protein
MAGVVLIAGGAIAQSQLPAIGAGGLLHPFRRSAVGRPPDSCDAVLFDGVGVRLKGWRCLAAGDQPSPGAQRDGFGGTGRRGRWSTCMASPTIAVAQPESSTASAGADSTSSHTIAARMASRTAPPARTASMKNRIYAASWTRLTRDRSC